MITVCFYKQRNGNIVSFEVSGHSAYAKEGQDIVCAAVSALAQTALLGLEHVANLKPIQEVKPGYLKCTLPLGAVAQAKDSPSQTILQTMQWGLKSLVKGYDSYVQLKEQEVE